MEAAPAGATRAAEDDASGAGMEAAPVGAATMATSNPCGEAPARATDAAAFVPREVNGMLHTTTCSGGGRPPCHAFSSPYPSPPLPPPPQLPIPSSSPATARRLRLGSRRQAAGVCYSVLRPPSPRRLFRHLRRRDGHRQRCCGRVEEEGAAHLRRLAVSLAKYTAELLAKFVAKRGAFTVVLSGGSLIKNIRGFDCLDECVRPMVG